MANIAPSFAIVHPSYIEPGILMPYTQASGAFDLLPEGAPLPRLSEGDLYAYVKRIDLRTKAAAGQAAYNALPGISTTLGMISTPSYLIRVRGEYDHHDTAAMANWGVPIVETQRLGMRQAHFQLARTSLLFGMNPAGGEGMLNATGATAINLPPDTFANDTVVTYDNGEMAIFLLAQIQSLKTRTNQLGVGHAITILGPQRVLGTFEYQNIVQLTQFQREGAGSATTAGVVKFVLDENEDTVLWVYDDTLIGAGAGGTDAVIINMPTVEQLHGRKTIDTNVFAGLTPGLAACALMYCDMAAPREIPTPLPGGAIDIVAEWRITSGWGVRPEAITIVSMQYE
jgi:hypothetical protein